ncbi:MAG: EscU/YscU/HrcU family type III secretion system export apparatus switch protein [Deltaproteobacteria bacterium]|nr:EscU/YscU/HrcU family type III secretion system export apparatus switch protein [Deltaproteobacteria bacterium]
MGDGGSGEKTEEPTPQKLKQARDKGQVSKSQDAIQAMMFVGVASVVGLTMGFMGDSLMEFLLKSIDAGMRKGDLPSALAILEDGIWAVVKISIPALGAAFVMAIASNYMQIGFMFTVDPLKPDIKKINPVSGFKQLFSKKKAVESIKQVIKFTLVSYVVYGAIKDSARDIIVSARMDLWAAMEVASDIIYNISTRVTGFFIAVAAADFFWQRYVFKKDMMMSKYDVKQEFKQSEGDPQQKAERKALAEELSMHGSQENVSNASAVVTNPAHIAVAIKYDDEKGEAPKVVAKGLRKNAEKIKEIARKAGVPILRNVPLAQALNKLDLDEEVPEELYEAVAEVLNFVMELKEQGKA